jgi:lysophospholipase L1-like esterase
MALVLLLVSAIGAIQAGPTIHAANQSYYIALGDSLAAGVQPNMFGINSPTNQGYVSDLYVTLQARLPHLQLINLGCGGTTTTLIYGGDCNYQAGSQLNYAQQVAQEHPGKIALVTVDIGDNDVEGCISGSSIDYACVSRGMADIRRNLPLILRSLRKAVGVKTPIAGLVDYDQFLAYWLRGDRAFAAASMRVVQGLNRQLRAIYRANDIPVANAAARFKMGELAPLVDSQWGMIPLAVRQVCVYTWACAPPPQGFNDHANAAGYKLIARTFAGVLLPKMTARNRLVS